MGAERTPSQAGAAYFAIQGLLVLGWWLVLLARPELARYFAVPGGSSVAFWAFVVPDVAVAGAGSLVAGWLAFRRSRRAPFAAFAVAGAIAYATLYCVAVWAATGAAAAAAAMIPAAVLSVWFAVAEARAGRA